MRYFIVFLFFGFSCTLAFGQKETEVFKKKSSDYPRFKYDRKEYDSLFIWNKQISIPGMNGFYSAKAKVAFTVDSTGNVTQPAMLDFEMEKIAGYITVSQTPEEIRQISADFKAEALRLVALTSGLWTPAQVDGKPLSRRMFSYVYFNVETERNFVPGQSSADEAAPGMRTSYLVRPNEGYKQSQLYNVAERKIKDNKPDLATVYYTQAIRYFNNKIVNSRGGDLDAYYNMGICYSKINDFENACKCWHTCSNMGDISVKPLLEKYCK